MKIKQRVLHHTLLLLAVVMGFSACQMGTEKDLTLFHGGTILTVDEAFSEVEAVVIQGQTIVAVGDYSDLENKYGKRSKFVKLDGQVMLPGFIDPHAHVVAGAVVDYVMDYVGMSRFKTTDEVLGYLKEKAESTDPGQWIVARNWDPAVQDGPEQLTFSELNKISTDHPIFILNASGHLAYANTLAFKMAGIGENIENPEGAEYVRDAHGNLNGVMKNMVAFMPVAFSIPAMQATNPVDAIINLTNEWNKQGITTTTELALGAGGSTQEWEQLKTVAAHPNTTARIRAYPSYANYDDWDEAGITVNAGNDMARIVGFKLVADGSNQGYTGLQREPYCCGMHQGSYGKEYTSLEALTRFARERTKQGWQLAIHGNGDAAIDNILTVIETLSNEGLDVASLRPRIEHASILHDEQIEKMKKYGVSASFLIGHVHYWGVFMRDMVFGEEKVQLLDRAHTVEKNNISYTLHSDFTVTNPDPLKMIEIAVNRRTFKEPDYRISPEEGVTVESAIRALTSEAAWQVMSEHEIGSIEVGKLADFVILQEDPRKVNPDKIAEIEVRQTWLNGKQVYTAE